LTEPRREKRRGKGRENSLAERNDSPEVQDLRMVTDVFMITNVVMPRGCRGSAARRKDAAIENW
jgi:hypothetical protein